MADVTSTAAKGPARALFVATILAGSFLLFLVQPMVARMALPRLGGAPNVWNSAMLVYQALLLAGYFYAHRLSQMPLRRQATIHLSLLAVAALTLPITLAGLPPPRPGTEVVWVPALLALTIGPVFFLVSAQAPLMQRWFAAHPQAGEPWALYAASNLGSFGGLIAYPLLVEPELSIRAQSWGWSIGYGLLLALIALAARARWSAADVIPAQAAAPVQPVPRRRIAVWLALAAVPSGLMLSTTTHLTTDIFAMPLLWVIPLGLYLLSFVIAFSDRRGPARAISALAWVAVLGAGGMAMISQGSSGLVPVMLSVALLFVICVALHARMYDLRPPAEQLTLFYLVMSAGGALGGVFTALIAPLVFDWVWEHPLLVLAAAALLPAERLLDWRGMRGLQPEMAKMGLGALVGIAVFVVWLLFDINSLAEPGWQRWLYTGALVVIGLLLTPWRWLVTALLLAVMIAQGGYQTLRDTRDGVRSRSYFGVYTVRDHESRGIRTLAHGTTLHGEQSLDPVMKRMPLSYYGPGSGAGIAFANASTLYGRGARLAVVGLGTGSLACYHQRGERLTYFEIDPAVLRYSQDGTFTYIRDCAPDTQVVLGDARLELAKVSPGSFNVLAIDAFSSDAIPLHLMTSEAFGVYLRALSPDGVLLVHISNRYIDLEPVLAAEVRARGLHGAMREDVPPYGSSWTASSWVAIARDPGQLARLGQKAPAMAWRPLVAPATRRWNDDHASILPYIQWRNFLGHPQ